MRQSKRKLLSLLLAVVLIFAGMPLTQHAVLADEDQPKLATPENPGWSDTNAVWDEVSGATSYTLYLMEGINTVKVLHDISRSNVSLFRWMEEGTHTYSFQVQANAVGYESSEWALAPNFTYTKSLPMMKDVTIDEDGDISWGEFEDATLYRVQLGDINNWVFGTSSNLTVTGRLYGLVPGVYEVKVSAYNDYQDGYGRFQISSPWVGEFEYKSDLPTLNNPTNLRWEDCVAKWDAPSGALYYLVELYEGEQLLKSFVNLPNTEQNMMDSLLDGEHTYSFKVQAYGTDYNPSDWVESPKMTFSKELPAIEDVKISAEGLMTWTAFPLAKQYEFSIGSFEGFVTGTSLDLKNICWKNEFATGKYEVTLRAFDSEYENRKQISGTWNGTYSYVADQTAPTKAPTKTPTGGPTKTPTISPTVTPTTAPGQPTPTTEPGQPTVTPTTVPGDPTVTPTTAPGEPTPTTAPDKDPTFEDFVERLYVVAMNRASDPSGKAFWVNKVVSGEYNGADCARYFLLTAPEFMNRNLDNDDFLEVLYRTFYDRDSDAAGKIYWEGRLKSGLPRADVVNAFIESTEWCNVCATYGVRSGALYHKAEFASKNAIKFATRLYTCCLARDPEQKGLNYWALALTNLEQTGCSAAKLFFTSTEFLNFKTSNAEYVKRLYRTFMGREPESSEVYYWTEALYDGIQTRASVMAFFGQSPEFTNICKNYGIERGTI